MARNYEKLSDEMSERIRSDIESGNRPSFAAKAPYIETEPNQIVVDYIASMTDDYCAELYKYLFPDSNLEIKYHGYFEQLDGPIEELYDNMLAQYTMFDQNR